jgi:predicted membrane protein
MIDRSRSAPLANVPPHHDQPAMLELSRIASLALAGTVLLALVLFPGLLRRSDVLLTQAVMPVLLTGIGASLAHGLGWRPRGSIWAAAVGPFVAWPLMFAAFAFLAFGAGNSA